MEAPTRLRARLLPVLRSWVHEAMEAPGHRCPGSADGGWPLISLFQTDSPRRIPALLLFATAALASAAHAQAPGVVVAAATRVPFPITVEAVGTARANESVEIRPQITETVTAIRFKEGQHVSAGDVLVELRSAEVRASVAAARAALAESESRYVRTKKLHEDNLISIAELEPAQAQRDRDFAALAAAEARLAETEIRAPFAGRLGLRRVSVGSLVTPSTIITTLDDTDVMKLDFDVPETAISRARTGLRVVAHSAAWPETSFTGRVISVDTRVDPVSRMVTVRALVPNPHDRLRPGMFMSVDLVRDDIVALVVPEAAIMPEQSRLFVLVVGEGNVVSKREVRIGRRRPGAVEVVEGLEEGDVVIVEGTQKARHGDTVEVLKQVEVTS